MRARRVLAGALLILVSQACGEKERAPYAVSSSPDDAGDNEGGSVGNDGGSRDGKDDAGGRRGDNTRDGGEDGGPDKEDGLRDAGSDDAGSNDAGSDASNEVTLPTCNDGIQNQDEYGVDCGPSCPGPCQRCPDAPELIVNGGFEDTGGSTATGQGRLPLGWEPHESTADTYSNDGSYGLAPGHDGHFPSVLAAEGIRWIAGADFPESFKGMLAEPVQTGIRYRVQAFLHRDTGTAGFFRPNPGGYIVTLLDVISEPTDVVVAGQFEAVASDDWEFRSFTFVIDTPETGPRSYSGILLTPVAETTRTYPGLDDLSMVQVSDCY